MSADLLRQAATVLRERADAATPGPWTALPGAGNVWRFPDEGSPSLIARGGHEGPSPADAAYIATMHPGVGHALADWLDNEASIMGDHLAALVVARAVLGETP
jgi:hypothetical protein